MAVLNWEGQKCVRKQAEWRFSMQKCASKTEERYRKETKEKVQQRISRTQIIIMAAIMVALSV